MPTPSEHKTVQARILAYTEAISWTFFLARSPRKGGRVVQPAMPGTTADGNRSFSLFFDDLLDAKVQEFNPRYAEAAGALALFALLKCTLVAQYFDRATK